MGPKLHKRSRLGCPRPRGPPRWPTSHQTALLFALNDRRKPPRLRSRAPPAPRLCRAEPARIVFLYLLICFIGTSFYMSRVRRSSNFMPRPPPLPGTPPAPKRAAALSLKVEPTSSEATDLLVVRIEHKRSSESVGMRSLTSTRIRTTNTPPLTISVTSPVKKYCV